MKRWTLLLLSCLIVFTGAYTAYWWTQANRVKAWIMAYKDNPNFVLNHEGIECSGFPFNIAVRIKNLHLTDKTETQELLIHGNTTVGVTISGDKGWIEVDGKMIIGDLRADKFSYLKSITLEGTSRMEAHSLKKYIHSMQTPLATAEDWIKMWDYLDPVSFHTKNFAFSFGIDNPPFVKVQKGFVQWEKVKAFDRKISLDLQGYEAIPQNLERFPLFEQILQKNPVWKSSRNVQPSKTNLILHTHLQFPLTTEERALYQSTTPLALEIEKMKLVNELGTTLFKGNFEFKQAKPKDFEWTLSFDTSSKWEAKHESLFAQYCYEIIDELETRGMLADYPEWESLLTQHWDEVAALLPDFSSFKSAECQLDLHYHLRHNEVSHEDEVAFDLKKCRFKVPQYEIATSGHKAFEDPVIPVWHLQVSNYRQFMQDMVSYYNRWRPVLLSAHLASELEMPEINSRVLNRLSTFLGSLSEAKDPQNLHLVFHSKEPNELTVGNLTSEQLETLTGQLWLDIAPDLYPQVYENLE